MGLGIVGLMTGAGAGQGLEAVLKRRLLEQQMQQQAAQQAEEMALRRESLAAETARNKSLDARNDLIYNDQQTRLNAAATRQKQLDDELRLSKAREALTETYAPNDMLGPGVAEEAAKVAPGLVKLIPGQTAMQTGQPTGMPGAVVKGDLQGGVGTVAARPITSTIGPTIGEYQGTSSQRRQVKADQRAEEAANLAENRFDAQQSQNDRMYQLALSKMNSSSEPKQYRIQTKNDKGENVGRVIDENGNVLSEWPLADSSAARDRGDAMKRMGSVLNHIDLVSSQINTLLGPSASLSGLSREAQSKVNADPIVRGYMAQLDTWAVFVGRSMGDNRISDLDIPRYRAMFPVPQDAKNVRDFKIASLRAIFDADNPDQAKAYFEQAASTLGIKPKQADPSAAPSPAPGPTPSPSPAPSPKPDAGMPFSYVHPNGKTYRFATQAAMDAHKQRTGGK